MTEVMTKKGARRVELRVILEAAQVGDEYSLELLNELATEYVYNIGLRKLIKDARTMMCEDDRELFDKLVTSCEEAAPYC